MGKREITELARHMRKHSTVSEEIFWQAVRKKQFNGVKFRRQHIIEHFVVDFYVPSHRLIIEIDGKIHLQTKEYDKVREQFFKERNFAMLRFKSNDIEDNLSGVLEKIKSYLVELGNIRLS